MSAIADLYRLLGSHFDSLTPAVKMVLQSIGAYSLSFLVIRFVIFICCKWKSDGLSNASATALAMLLATVLWPALDLLCAWLASSDSALGALPFLDEIALFFVAWLFVELAFAPVSSAMGLLLLVVYLARAKRLSSCIIYISVAATMFGQCLYMYYVDLDFH